MKTATANLRISYLGAGYDFPQFFEHTEVPIITYVSRWTAHGCYFEKRGHTNSGTWNDSIVAAAPENHLPPIVHPREKKCES